MMRCLPFAAACMLTLLLSLPAGGCSMMEAPPTAEAREKTVTDAAPKTRQRQGPEIVIRTQAGARHAVSVEVARTPRARQQGLMHRDSLADGHGMLFIMPSIRVHSFWMKNTLIPLDMLFFDNEGRFVSAVEKAAPESLVSRRSSGPAKYVLELNGGSMQANGIGPHGGPPPHLLRFLGSQVRQRGGQKAQRGRHRSDAAVGEL